MKQIPNLSCRFRNIYGYGYGYRIWLDFYQPNDPWFCLPWNKGNEFFVLYLKTNKLDKHYQHIISSTILLLK